MVRRLASRLLALSAVLIAAPTLEAQSAPTPVPGLVYDVEFFPGTSYDDAVPTAEEIVGFSIGERAAFPAEIERLIVAWSAASPRAELFEYARSHEGRPLYYLAIGSPANIARLDEIKSGLARLADPRGLEESEARPLLESLPVTAWMAYSIHGDETSGSDGALGVAYHLIAGRGAEIERLLEEVLVLVDPMMNPDGRHRFLQQVAEHRSEAPNLDEQSLVHSGYWPWGRANHYLFDLNRDWTLGVNPETRGRIRAAAEWHPLLFVDAHEMGALDTFLFGSAREPRNPNFPPRRAHWQSLFARDQAAAFDAYNWKYYTGEWNEGWYPGYSDSWGEFRGAIGILYEQARIADDAVRQPEGTLTTYRQATHHQAVSSMANLTTLARNGRELLAEFLAEKQRNVDPDGPWANRTFAVLPTTNRARLDAFVDQMNLQGFEVYVAPADLPGRSGVDQLGLRFSDRTVPAGTLLVPNRQPQAPLVSTMLEFDRPMPEEYLAREREAILRTGRSTIYDVTSWNLTMLYGLPAITLDGDLPRGVEPFAPTVIAAPPLAPAETPVGWVIDGVDDASVVAAARLMERGILVRVADEPFELGGPVFARGSLLVLPADNAGFDGDLAAVLSATGAELGLVVATISTGLGEGDLPDVGGGHFHLLEPPRIALAARQSYSSLDFGEIWHLLDQRIGIRHSHLDAEYLAFNDLRRYNVLVLPHRWYGELSASTLETLERWVEAGGTLIALSASARQLTGESSKLSRVRQLEDVLDELDDYELALLREWMAASGELPSEEAIWSHGVAESLDYPWSDLGSDDRPAAGELARRDAWERLFASEGAILAARTDPEHWLTFGTPRQLPVIHLSTYGNAGVLMAGSGVEAPVRFGVHTPASGTETRRLGWGPVPAGHELRLRMSGLLWPEAGRRLANSAYLTREPKGRGQVILFATSASFRGAALGTARLLMNALIYGPGFGAQHPIRP